MVGIDVDVAVSDACTRDSRCRIISVSSNEDVDDEGPGNTGPDWKITGDLVFRT
jgi:hypothetical protein